MVQVSYRRGPSGNDQPDAQAAELIIWHTLRYRFGALVIVKTAGGCAGLVCVSESGVVARATYAQLAARFGPRPAWPGRHERDEPDRVSLAEPWRWLSRWRS